MKLASPLRVIKVIKITRMISIGVPDWVQVKKNTVTLLRLLFVLATEHTLLHMLLITWHQILFPGDLHDDTL